MERRDFLRITGAAAGGLILGCGGRRGAGGLPVPNGYRFHRIVGPGTTLPDGTVVARVGEGAMMNGRGQVVLFADTAGGRGVMYELNLDLTGPQPAIGTGRRLVSQGDVLGGSEVRHIGYGSSNQAGQHAVVLRMASGLIGVYADWDRTGLQPALLPTGTVGWNGSPALNLHGHFGDVDMDDAGNLLAKVALHTVARPSSREALLHVQARNGTCTVVAEEGADLPGSSERIQGFGLLDLARANGHYAAQVFGAGRTLRGTPAATGMVRGHVAEDFTRARTLAASTGAAVRDVLRPALVTGEVSYGPRIGADGRVAQVVHPAAGSPVLTFDGRELMAPGGRTPLGHAVTGMGSPVITGQGLLYTVLESAGRTAELCIHDGLGFRTVLTTGDPVLARSGAIAPIRGFSFGALRDAMDESGRMAMIGAFDDGLHLVVGVPG